MLFSCSKTIDLNETTNSTEDNSYRIHFFSIGDWGYNGHPDQMAVKYAMNNLARQIKLDFILSVGDNFQFDGVKNENDSLWKINFENVYLDSLNVPWYIALGNHDYYGNEKAQLKYSDKNKLWVLPSKYYSFIQPIDSTCAARFIILDTHDLISNFKILNFNIFNSQYIWLKNTLKNCKEKWVFVIGHHPVFSACHYNGDVKELKTVIKPLLDAYKVDFYLCGHDHDFEHAKEKGKYTDYFVNGTGGTTETLNPASYNERTQFSISTLGFMHIAMGRNAIKLDFIDSKGEVKYIYIKKKL